MAITVLGACTAVKLGLSEKGRFLSDKDNGQGDRVLGISLVV